MARTSNLTPEMEVEIATAYSEGVKIKKLSEMFDMNEHLIYKAVRNRGVELRNPARSTGEKRRKKKRHCECGAVMPAEAKYCFMCGKSLKTDEEIIIDGLLAARTVCLRYAPDAHRDTADKQIMAAVTLLKEKCGVK